MSSFTQHKENIKELEKMGFDVSEAIEDGEVTFESWGYDDLTYLIADIVSVLKKQKFKVKMDAKNHYTKQAKKHFAAFQKAIDAGDTQKANYHMKEYLIYEKARK